MDYTPDEIDARIQADPEMQQLAQDDETEFLSRHAEIYKEFGYKPDGTPIRTAQKMVSKASKALGIPEDIGHAAAALPLPMAATFAGTIAGSPGGPAGALVGASGGSVLGEAANSLLGITDPMTKTDMGIAAAAPLAGLAVGRAGAGAAGLAKRLLPGSGAGLNEYAAEQFAKKLSSMRVTAADVDAARAGMSLAKDFKVPVPNLQKLFADESASIAQQASKGIPGTDSYLKDLNKIIAENPELNSLLTQSSMNFKDLMTLEKGFNSLKGERPGEVWAAASGKIIDEIEAMASNTKLHPATKAKAAEGLDAFKKFIAVNNKFKADETLVDMFKPGGKVVKTVAGDTNLVLFDQKAFKDQLANNKILKKAFSPAEIQEMRESVTDIGYISRPPSNSADAMNLAKRYGAGGMAGWMIAGPTGAFAGAGLEELIRKAVTSEPGRKAMKYLAVKGRGKIDGLELQTMLGKIVAGASAGVVPGVTGRGSDPLSTQPFANEE
jgi:hypothetical protein